MRNNPIIMNQISKLFKEDWDCKIKIIQKPCGYNNEDLCSPLFKRKFLNFNYIDPIYRDEFIENLNVTNIESFFYAVSYSMLIKENDIITIIAEEFEKFCRHIFNSEFKLKRNEQMSLYEALYDCGSGTKTLFYIYLNLLLNEGQNLVINNAELSVHPVSIVALKYAIELFLSKSPNSKIIFLMNRYDLFKKEFGLNNLYLLKKNNEIKRADTFDFNKSLDLQTLLVSGKFGEEWKI